MPTRLVRYLAQCGVASRRGAGDLVKNGIVAINGETTENPAYGVEDTDTVTVRGKAVQPPESTLVLMLNKPAGQVCSVSDPHNPETVLDNLPKDLRGRLKPVGRLDKNTTGLLFLTDDGDLAFRLTHPSHGVNKTYRALVQGIPTETTLRKLREGVELDDGMTSPAQARVVDLRGNRTEIEIVLHEGRNRQVRRMCEAVGHKVLSLRRVAFGSLTLGSLRPGATRPIEGAELATLRRSVGLD